MVKRSIRQSQTLFPFGVGAIMDHDGQSFVACDITEWTTPVRVTEGRLEGILGVDHFRMPPKYDERNHRRGVPYYRFPRWFFCPRHSCRKMRYLTYHEETGKRPECLHCRTPLVPMRLVMACDRGHLADVPWDNWAHRNGNGSCKDDRNLEFRMRSNGRGGLEDLYVVCSICKCSNSLEKIMQPNFRCSGKHPWRNTHEPCDGTVRVLQRNASNLRYDSSVEAISIPPHSDFEYWGDDARRIRQHPLFERLANMDPDVPVWSYLVDEIAGELNIDPDNVEQIARAQNPNSGTAQVTDDKLYESEYAAIKKPDVRHHPKDKFQKRNIDLKDYLKNLKPETDPEDRLIVELSRQINRVVILDRLRCIRVLRGFYRISRDHFVSADVGGGSNWLPAVEYIGEGVFIEINPESLRSWEAEKEVRGRGKVMQERFFSQSEGSQEILRQFQQFCPTPRFLMLHTLAHLVMLQMQYACGYSMSSIRERIYCNYPGDEGIEMSGILLFTSAGDAEGGMGGLARLGEPHNLFPMLAEALYGSTVCSYDPVCIESHGQGLDGLNLAACHSCCLIPETSCTHRNQYLDRAMLCGTADNPKIGYFSQFIEEAEKIW